MSTAKRAAAANAAASSDDLDGMADYFADFAAFLRASASKISSLGAPDTPGGTAMASEVPATFRDAATKFDEIATDLRAGSTRALTQLGMVEWDPLTSMSTQAQDVWNQVESELAVNADCVAVSGIINGS